MLLLFQHDKCVYLHQLKHWPLEIIAPCIISDDFDKSGSFLGNDGKGNIESVSKKKVQWLFSITQVVLQNSKKKGHHNLFPKAWPLSPMKGPLSIAQAQHSLLCLPSVANSKSSCGLEKAGEVWSKGVSGRREVISPAAGREAAQIKTVVLWCHSADFGYWPTPKGCPWMTLLLCLRSSGQIIMLIHHT